MSTTKLEATLVMLRDLEEILDEKLYQLTKKANSLAMAASGQFYTERRDKTSGELASKTLAMANHVSEQTSVYVEAIMKLRETIATFEELLKKEKDLLESGE